MADEQLLRYFEYDHLPPRLRHESAPFGVVAHRICREIPASDERTAALRKLLESKDCAVRAALDTAQEG